MAYRSCGHTSGCRCGPPYMSRGKRFIRSMGCRRRHGSRCGCKTQRIELYETKRKAKVFRLLGKAVVVVVIGCEQQSHQPLGCWPFSGNRTVSHWNGSKRFAVSTGTALLPCRKLSALMSSSDHAMHGKHGGCPAKKLRVSAMWADKKTHFCWV